MSKKDSSPKPPSDTPRLFFVRASREAEIIFTALVEAEDQADALTRCQERVRASHPELLVDELTFEVKPTEVLE